MKTLFRTFVIALIALSVSSAYAQINKGAQNVDADKPYIENYLNVQKLSLAKILPGDAKDKYKVTVLDEGNNVFEGIIVIKTEVKDEYVIAPTTAANGATMYTKIEKEYKSASIDKNGFKKINNCPVKTNVTITMSSSNVNEQLGISKGTYTIFVAKDVDNNNKGVAFELGTEWLPGTSLAADGMSFTAPDKKVFKITYLPIGDDPYATFSIEPSKTAIGN